MYRTIDAAFWTDPKIKELPAKCKLLALYLVSNPHSHVGGIYYLPDSIIKDETGLTQSELDTLSDTLSRSGFCRIDKKTQVIWVVKMFFYQGRGDKNERSVAKHLNSLHNSLLIKDFIAAYPSIKKHFVDRVSIGYPAQDHFGTQEQEQDITSTIVEDSSEPLRAAAEPTLRPVFVLTFPTVGKGSREWGITQEKIDEYQTAYPGVNVLCECRKARQWAIDNPTKRKTAGGMPAFINRWLAKVQDKGTVSMNAKFNAKEELKYV
jgi:hypothetical protein